MHIFGVRLFKDKVLRTNFFYTIILDRYYGVCLAKYQHSDVVNSVAFNPKDNEMLVTTSDDFEIKIWRSQAAVAKQRCVELGRAVETRSKI